MTPIDASKIRVSCSKPIACRILHELILLFPDSTSLNRSEMKFLALIQWRIETCKWQCIWRMVFSTPASFNELIKSQLPKYLVQLSSSRTTQAIGWLFSSFRSLRHWQSSWHATFKSKLDPRKCCWIVQSKYRGASQRHVGWHRADIGFDQLQSSWNSSYCSSSAFSEQSTLSLYMVVA